MQVAFEDADNRMRSVKVGQNKISQTDIHRTVKIASANVALNDRRRRRGQRGHRCFSRCSGSRRSGRACAGGGGGFPRRA